MTDFGRILHAVFSLKKLDINFWLESDEYLPRNPNFTEIEIKNGLPDKLLTELTEEIWKLVGCVNFKRWIRILDVSYSNQQKLVRFRY